MVITWTVNELAGVARILIPGVAPARWQRYSRGFDTYRPQIRPTAPAAHSQRLGNYQLTEVGSARVLCVKSELHLNQDGVKTGEGIATVPATAARPAGRCSRPSTAAPCPGSGHPDHHRDRCGVVLTIGTAGSVFDDRGDHLGGQLLHRLRPSTIGALASWAIAIPLLRAVSANGPS